MAALKIKRMFIVAAIVIGFAVIVNILTDTISDDSAEYISDTSEKVQYSDVKDYLSKVDFGSSSNRDLFKSGTVNKYTLKFFKYLQGKFKDMDFSEHIDSVREYLYSVMNHKDADDLLVLYKTYLDYENRVANEINNAGELKTAQDLLKVLKKMKTLQYELFGKDTAEIIFGAMMKAQEYPIRRGGIVNDNSLYASEKEKLLQKLNSDMWGAEGDRIEKSRKPYVAYTETLSIYSKDISEMNDKDKQLKIKEIRKTIFPPEVVQRLEEVDSSIEAEKERDTQYQKEYALIVNRTDISADEKKIRIRDLQDKLYGEDADSMRRIESITSGSDELKKSYNTN